MSLLATTLESDIGSALQALPASSAAFWSGGLNSLLNNLAQTFLVVAVAVALFVLILGGIKWATGGGDKEALGSAQKMITSAIIGLVIVFSTWAIINLVKNFFGIGGGGGGGAAPGGVYTWGGNVCPPESVACPRERWQQSWCAADVRCICGNDLKYHVMSEQHWCELAVGDKQVRCKGGNRVLNPGGATYGGPNLNCPGD